MVSPDNSAFWPGVAAVARPFACLAVVCVLLARPVPAYADGLRRVTLQLPSRHRMQFAGFYMAKELGYYREAGLEVEIRERCTDISTVDQVVMGQAEFGLSSIVIESCLHGMPLMVLAAISQHSPFVMVITGDTGIRRLEDLRGRTIRTPNAHLQFNLEAMLDAVGIAPGEIQLGSLPQGVDDLDGDAGGEAIFCHRGGLPVEMEMRGIPFTMFHPRDFGVNSYGEILFASRAFALRNPEVVDAFRKASRKGWAYAVNHMDEAVALVQAVYAPDADRGRLEREARIVRELVSHDTTPFGLVDPFRWNTCMEALARLRHLPFDAARSSGALFDTAMAVRARRWARIMRFALAGTLLAVLTLGGVTPRADAGGAAADRRACQRQPRDTERERGAEAHGGAVAGRRGDLPQCRGWGLRRHRHSGFGRALSLCESEVRCMVRVHGRGTGRSPLRPTGISGGPRAAVAHL